MKKNRLEDFWNNPKTDSVWSWVILGTTWCLLALTNGFYTTGCVAVFFVEFSTVFHANRKEAALPFGAIGIAQCIAGLFTGMILNYFDLRLVMLSCITLISSALALCFVATSLLYISFFFGIILGAAGAVVWTGSLVLIQQYFKKHMTTANGILMTGMPLAGAFIPSLLNHLINEYGLRGSMLLYSGLVLHLLIFGPFMRPRTVRHYPVLIQQQKILHPPANSIHQNKNNSSNLSSLRDAFQTYRIVIIKPMFYVITLPGIVAMNVMVGLSMTLLDFALDSGLTRDYGLFLVAIFSSAGILGRIGVGCFADRGWVTKETLSVISLFLMTICLVLLGLVQHISWITTMVILVGFGEGSISSITNVLYPKYLNAESISTALGLRLFAAGICGMFRPLLIGYLRDALQTHFYFYCILGGFCLMSGLLWLPTLYRFKNPHDIVIVPKCPTNSTENPPAVTNSVNAKPTETSV